MQSVEVGKIKFRRLEVSDLQFLLEVRNECRSFLHDDREFSLDQCRQWFASANPEFWMIYVGRESIGYMRVTGRSAKGDELTVGADLHKQWRGKGLGFSAWNKFLTNEFKLESLQTVRLEVLCTNHRAITLYWKVGFEFDGLRNRYVDRADGSTVYSLSMSICRQHWMRLNFEFTTSS